MLKAHPDPPLAAPEVLADCIRAVFECAQSCTACADACLAEHGAERLVHCIRVNQDCADICDSTARILTRQTAPDLGLVTMAIELCAAACQACALECGRHAPYHMQCQVCTAACHRAHGACHAMLIATAHAARLHH